MRSLRVALAALALAGCAGGEDEAAAPQSDDPAVLLARAADRLREQATFSYTATYTRTRSDQPNDPLRYGETEGALDHAAKRGRMTLQFDLGLPELDDPITLRWNTAELEAELGGHVRRMARGQARRTGGLIGRAPDEPEALDELLEGGREARVVGEDEIDGEQTTHIAFNAPTTVGVPAEVAVGAGEGLLSERMPAEAWIDADGLARRLSYTLRFPATKAFPARTVVGVYDLADFGEPVSGLEFKEQAG
jgi:hypothetical protein